MPAPRRRRSLLLEERLLRSMENLHLGDVGGRLRLAPKPLIPATSISAGGRPASAGVNVHKIAVRATQAQSVDDQALVEWELIEQHPRGQVGFSQVTLPTTQLRTDITGPAIIAVEAGRWSGYRSDADELIVIEDASGTEYTIPLDSAGMISSRFFGFTPAVELFVGDLVGLRPNLSGSAQTLANCRLQIQQIERRSALGQESQEVLETVWFNERLHNSSSPKSSTMTLESGVIYEITVTGNCRHHEDFKVYDSGNPDAVLFPDAGAWTPEIAGFDYETQYAMTSSEPNEKLDHRRTPRFGDTNGEVQINVGSGWYHHEPIGGPYSTPTPGHVYVLHVTGEGSPLQIRTTDTPIGDNNGLMKFEIRTT